MSSGRAAAVTALATALVALAIACGFWPAGSHEPWPADPAAREALCSERWPALAPEQREPFAEAADGQTLFGRSLGEAAEISVCLAERRPALVERLTEACAGDVRVPARAARLVETHLRACAVAVSTPATDANRPDATVIDEPASEAATRCVEAPQLHAPASETDALRAELVELEEEEEDLHDLYERLSTRSGFLGDSGGSYAAGRRWSSGDRARGAAYERLHQLPLVIEAFALRCVWPAEDAADREEPAARAQRSALREHWTREREERRAWPLSPW